VQEPPVVSFVRDAHDKKRQMVHNRRLQLPRWQKIQQSSTELFGREGGSATLTATNTAETPAHSQDSVEIDTHKGVVVSKHVLTHIHRVSNFCYNYIRVSHRSFAEYSKQRFKLRTRALDYLRLAESGMNELTIGGPYTETA
jgi:hypothetical protein